MSEKNDKLLENDLIPSRLGVIQCNVAKLQFVLAEQV